MNLHKLEADVKRRIGALYLSKFPKDGSGPHEVAGFDETMKRLRRHQKAIQAHYPVVALREGRKERTAKSLERFARILKHRSHKCFVSIDIERTKKTTVREVGITVFRGGTSTSYNFRVEGTYNTTPFAFGNSQVVSREVLQSELTRLLNMADFYVGHSIDHDFGYLKDDGYVIPKRPFYDTLHLFEPFCNSMLKLTEVCEQVGVDASRPHCAGNDARYSMDVMFAMAEKFLEKDI